MEIRQQRSSYSGIGIGLFLCMVAINAFSQHESFLFKHLTVSNGLSNDNVRAIIQDKKGFMWFGTDLGLNKFDGHSIAVYKHNLADSNSLIANSVSEILEDSYGYFWVGTQMSGLDRFDREQEIFHHYTQQNLFSNASNGRMIRVIFEDSKRNLWIGTAGGGLFLYNRATDAFKQFTHDPGSEHDIGSNFICSIAEDREGFLWFGTPEGFLVKYDHSRGQGTRVLLKGAERTDRWSMAFNKVCIDSDNNIWMGNESGLYYYNTQTGKVKHFTEGNSYRNLKINSVTSVLEMEKGKMLISTDHGGLNILNVASSTFTYQMSSMTDPATIRNNQLYDIYRSPEGIIWIGSYRGGVNILDPQAMKFAQYENLVDPSEKLNGRYSVLSICEDPDKNIWIGKDGEGIDIYNPTTRAVTHLKGGPGPHSPPGNMIKEISRDHLGNMWIGTYKSGMAMYHWKTKRFIHFPYDENDPRNIGFSSVWSIIEDRERNMWIGTFGNGLNKLDRNHNLVKSYKLVDGDTTSLIDNWIISLLQDSRGRIWVGTRLGLCLYNEETDDFVRFLPGSGIEHVVYDIYEDNQGRIWIGTDFSLNLYLPDENRFEHFQAEEGLLGDVVYAFAGEKEGKLWLSTNRGLSYFDIKEKKFRNFYLEDGLQDIEFNYTASYWGSDGKMYFGGKNGMNVFHPDSIHYNTRIPPVFFTGLKILNKTVSPRQPHSVLTRNINFTKKIILSHKQNIISVAFAALNFTNTENKRYAARLDGFEEEWNDLGNRNEVTYTNLSQGKYFLRVRASNNDGYWNEKGAVLEIIVLPPWWKSWWFETLFFLSLISMVVGSYYMRVTFLRNQQRKLERLVQERTMLLEEVAVTLEEKQEEINSQNEELMAQRDELENANNMLVEQKQMILEQNSELDKHRSKLEILVEERARELTEAKEKAEESDRLKSSFLANLSHEIRTPLNAILGFSSLLGDSSLDAAERREYNRIIRSSSNTLLDLISDILDISRIEAGQMELVPGPVSLEGLISDIKGIYDLFARREDIGWNKTVEFRIKMDERMKHLHILADKLRLEQVLSNLLSNALKFTHKGFVELGCSITGEPAMLTFYVKDTGIGIKEEHQKVIFERFRKLEDDKTRLQRGTGLGLSISARLVNLMGGNLSLISKEDEGSVFTFAVPLVLTSETRVEPQKPALSNQVPDLQDSLILVAEDDFSNYQYMEKLLKKANARVLHATNGLEVLKMLEVHSDIRLIFMDIKMPEMDGIETLVEMKRRNIHIPVIAQTAYVLADEVVKLKNEGFHDYIAKPIPMEDLYILVHKYTGVPNQSA